MKLIIDIPEDAYRFILQHGIKDTHKIDEIIANGTPLPKGHDRLVEAKAVIKALFAHQTIDDVPTIIEADRENNSVGDNLPSCNSCAHNGEWSCIGNCIKCRGFDRYERRGNQ